MVPFGRWPWTSDYGVGIPFASTLAGFPLPSVGVQRAASRIRTEKSGLSA